MKTTFDLVALRSFVAGVELGSFARAADRLGRSTSAISAQLKKLEEQAGTPIFRKAGRGLALTASGETMLAYARRLLELNDEASSAVASVELEGWVRLGMQEDFGDTVLTGVLGRFARAHPKVRVECRVVRGTELIERVETGRLDLALAWSNGTPTSYCRLVGELPMCWVGAVEPALVWQRAGGEPLPLAALEAPCLLRTAATDALDAAGIAWRLAFVSPSLGGIWAATAAGLGITIRTPLGLPAKVRALDSDAAGLPALPPLGLMLHQAEREVAPAAVQLAGLITEAVQAAVIAAGGVSIGAERLERLSF